jgi:hypothetical protein
MPTMEQEATPQARSTEELRAQMYRILDELCTARSDEAAQLKARFEALWKQVGGEDSSRTVH